MQTRLRLTAFALAMTVAPQTAWACGGFFNTTEPVDQEAERIIFRQLDAETVESYIEIRFQGDPREFAWVVPVPGVPKIETFPAAAFDALDVATEPRFDLPDGCRFSDDRSVPPQGGNVEVGEPSATGVTVLASSIVGDYETETLSATGAAELYIYLNDNGFRVVEQMVPFIELYIGQGLNFVAVKLRSDLPNGAGSITPLKLTYKSERPMIPLRLTSMAAVPEMGVKVFILGEERFTTDGVPELEIDASAIVWDSNTRRSNYASVVARTIDGSLGEGMVVDMAGETGPVKDRLAAARTSDSNPEQSPEEIERIRALQEGEDAVAALVDASPYLTRFYGRYSPEEMGVDLFFRADASRPNVDRSRALPVAQVLSCQAGEPAPEPCDYSTCGQGGTCIIQVSVGGEPSSAGGVTSGDATSPDDGIVSSAGRESDSACACVDGAVARAVRDPDGSGDVRISCVDDRIRFDFENVKPIYDIQPISLPALPDPCAQNPCGENGECVSMNGAQSCRCDRGYVAIAKETSDGELQAVCVSPKDELPASFYQRRLPDPQLPYPGKIARRSGLTADNGCTLTVPGAQSPSAALALLALAIPLLRRRRR